MKKNLHTFSKSTIFLVLTFYSFVIFGQNPYIVDTEGLGKYGYLEKDATTYLRLNSNTHSNIKQLFGRTWVNGQEYNTYGSAVNVCGSTTNVPQSTNNFNFISGTSASAGQNAFTSVKAEYCDGYITPSGFNEREHFIFDVSERASDNSSSISTFLSAKNVVLSLKIDFGSLSNRILKRFWIQNSGNLQETTDIPNDGFTIFYEPATGTETFDGNESSTGIYGDYSGNSTTNNEYGSDNLNIAIPSGGLRIYVVLNKFNSCITTSKNVAVSLMNDGLSFLPNMDTNYSLARVDKIPSNPSSIAVNISGPTSGPMSGNYYVPSVCYPTMKSIVDALNANGVNGPVTVNVDSGYTETAPATTIIGGTTYQGGYNITATGTLANPIIFKKNGSGANPTFTASNSLSSSMLTDAIFKIIGGDYITIDGFTMQENPSNTTITTGSNNMTEWGVALLDADAANGAQNNTIQNCTIVLNKIYPNSFGIYSNTNHSATNVGSSPTVLTSSAGSNSNNKFYNNDISNVNVGIALIGSATAGFLDSGNDIGGNSASTGNKITNWGGTGATSSFNSNTSTNYGIFLLNQINENTSYNTITSTSLSTSNIATGGIFKNYSVQPTGTITSKINNNTITVTNSPATANMTGGYAVVGINNQGITSALSTATFNINNNTIKNCVLGGSTATTSKLSAILVSTAVGTINVTGNTITGNNVTSTALSTGGFEGISLTNTSGSPTTAIVTNNNINNTTVTVGSGTATTITISAGTDNTISNNTISNIQTTAGANVGISASSGTNTINANTISNLQSTSGAASSISISNGANSNNVSNNTINGITTTTGTANGISSSAGTTNNINNNIISSIQTLTGVANGIELSGGTTTNVYKNKVYAVTATGAINSGSVSGISIPANPTNANIYNNTIGLLTAPIGDGDNLIRGISISAANANTNNNIYFNTVFLNASSTGNNFGSSGIWVNASSTATTSKLVLRNNIIVNNSIQKGTGYVSAYRRTAQTLQNYDASSNNNIFYAGNPSANNLIFYDGTNKDQTLTSFQARNTTLESASAAENVSFQSIVGTDSNFLRIADGTTSYAEAGATTISGITDDFWGVNRNATTPDIGASEFSGVKKLPTITNVTGTGCIGSSITITGTNFDNIVAANVKINGTQVASITSVTGTQIVAVIAPSTTSGNVTVTNVAGTATYASFTVNPVVNNGTVTYTDGSSGVNHLVISQIYGGGGNMGASYQNDFVEIFNPTPATIDITGWKLQYASATGNFVDNSSSSVNLSGTIGAGKYLLIKMISGGAVGNSLPTDDIANPNLNIAVTAGKVQLINSISAVIDLVGYGNTVSLYEGTAIPGISSNNVLSYQRKNAGCTDTDNNFNDFTNNTNALPRNSSTPQNLCGSIKETICEGATPTSMSVTGASGAGSFTYQWYYKTGLETSAPTGNSLTGWISLNSVDGANTATYSPKTATVGDVTFACFVTPIGNPCGAGTWASGMRQLTVNPTVSAGTVNGTVSTIIIGATTTYTTTSSGGSWSSDNTAVATVDSTGKITGVSAGTANIIYTVLGCGGPKTAQKAINVTDTTTWDGTAWDYGAPNSNIKAVIAGNYDTSVTQNNISSFNLKVNNNTSLKITSGFYVKILNELSGNGTITVESDGNLVQTNDAVNTFSGNFTAKRTINLSTNRQEYNYLSSPTVGFNMKNVYPGGVVAPYVLYYNEANDRFYSSSGVYIPGRALAVKEPSATFGGNSIDATFTGLPANGLQTIQLAWSGVNNGNNLVGNPYPSNIDIKKMYDDPENTPNISPTFYFWDNTKNTIYEQMGSDYALKAYATFNAADGPNGTGIPASYNAINSLKTPTKIVSVAQGFLVQANSASPLKFKNSYREVNSSGANFFGKTAMADTDRFWLKLISPTNVVNTIAIVYFDKGNNAFAPDDSPIVDATSDAIFSLAENQKVEIQGKSTFINTDVVQLGTNHYTTGNYTIALDNAEGIFATNQEIYLHDKLSNTYTNLKEGNFTFFANPGEISERFEIVYLPQSTLAVSDTAASNLIVYKDGNKFIVKTSKDKLTGIEMYDYVGRLLLKLKPNSTEVNIPAENLPNGTYILKIYRANKEIVSRKIRK